MADIFCHILKKKKEDQNQLIKLTNTPAVTPISYCLQSQVSIVGHVLIIPKCQEKNTCTYYCIGLSAICCIAACFRILKEEKKKKKSCAWSTNPSIISRSTRSPGTTGAKRRGRLGGGWCDCRSAFVIFHMIP